MTAVLFSRDWYRIASLKPKLHRHVEVHVHRYRGERWYVLQNHSTGQFRRLTAQAYLLVGLMDGKREIEDIWQLSSERLGEELPTHEEVVQLVGDLHRSNIIKMDHCGDAAESLRFGEEQKHKKWLGKLRSPLSVQIPLLDPNKFLDKTEKGVGFFFSKTFMVILLMMITMLAVLSWRHWEPLTANISDQILAADNLLLMWLVYPLIKICHELGHAYTVKRYGGQVHEVGVMLLVFFPMPYVDASASTSFANKHQRMLVDAAGMIVELFIAAIAMVVWIGAEDGLIKSFAYNILFIAGVSTLLFNGNPLLRFDGYYLLSDWLEMPNLSKNSNRYWGYLCKSFLFGLRKHQSTANTCFEAVVFTIYGAASFIYRIIISITIALFVASKYFFLGAILAIWSVVIVWLWPLLKMLWQTIKDQEINTSGRSPFIVLPLIFTLFYVLLFELGLPKTTSIEGVVLAKEDSRLVVKEGCFFNHWLKKSGEYIAAGENVFTCDNQKLNTELKAYDWQLKELKAKLLGNYNDPVQVKVLKEEILLLTNTIAVLNKRIKNLNIKSQVEGFLYTNNQGDNNGKWLKKGDVLGYVVGENRVKINALLPEYLINEVRDEVKTIQLMSSSKLMPITNIRHWTIFPSTSKDIISPILAVQGGGEVILDPTQESKTLDSYFYVEVLPKDQLVSFINQRVYIQFIHTDEPLGYRVYRIIRRTFLSYFDI